MLYNCEKSDLKLSCNNIAIIIVTKCTFQYLFKALPPWCTRAERRQVEKLSCEALSKLDGELKGKYYSLTTMTDKEQDQLIADHFLFDRPVSPLLTCAGMVSIYCYKQSVHRYIDVGDVFYPLCVDRFICATKIMSPSTMKSESDCQTYTENRTSSYVN